MTTLHEPTVPSTSTSTSTSAGLSVWPASTAEPRPGDLAVDGGMSDNPRPALYGVRCAPRLIGRHSVADPARVTVVGRHCEAGDILAADVELPCDVSPGDLLAVPVAGAYHLSMASAYTWSAAHRSLPYVTAAPVSWYAASPWTTSAAATWVCNPRGT